MFVAQIPLNPDHGEHDYTIVQVDLLNVIIDYETKEIMYTVTFKIYQYADDGSIEVVVAAAKCDEEYIFPTQKEAVVFCNAHHKRWLRNKK